MPSLPLPLLAQPRRSRRGAWAGVRLPSQQPVHPNICSIPPCRYLGKGRPEHFWREAKRKAGRFASTQRRCRALCVCKERSAAGTRSAGSCLPLSTSKMCFVNLPTSSSCAMLGSGRAKPRSIPAGGGIAPRPWQHPKARLPRDPGLCRELGPRHEKASTVFLPCAIQAQYQLKTALFKKCK